jgi:hypothetical protein
MKDNCKFTPHISGTVQCSLMQKEQLLYKYLRNTPNMTSTTSEDDISKFFFKSHPPKQQQ